MENPASLDERRAEGPPQPRRLLGGRPWHLETAVSKSPGLQGHAWALSLPHSGSPQEEGEQVPRPQTSGRLEHCPLPVLDMELQGQERALAGPLTGPLELGARR